MVSRLLYIDLRRLVLTSDPVAVVVAVEASCVVCPSCHPSMVVVLRRRIIARQSSQCSVPAIPGIYSLTPTSTSPSLWPALTAAVTYRPHDTGFTQHSPSLGDSACCDRRIPHARPSWFRCAMPPSNFGIEHGEWADEKNQMYVHYRRISSFRVSIVVALRPGGEQCCRPKRVVFVPGRRVQQQQQQQCSSVGFLLYKQTGMVCYVL